MVCLNSSEELQRMINRENMCAKRKLVLCFFRIRVSPSEGEHTCKLYVKDEGEIVEKSVHFKTISLSNRPGKR